MTVEVSTLENGIRVVTDYMAHLETASIGIWVDVGSRHEPKHLNGISHLLEHMAFKGTTTRSAKEIAEEIEAVGGYLNAYTSRDHTTYYARVMSEDIPLAVDILSDIVCHAKYDAEELQREKQVILQEIGQSRDTPDDMIFDVLQELAYPDQPLGRSILGTVASVSRFQPADLVAFMEANHKGEALVVSAAGNIDHGLLCALVEKQLGHLTAKRNKILEPARYMGGSAREQRKLEQLHIALGFEGVAFEDVDYYAMHAFSTIFGGGMSSRLFQHVREKRGLAYSIYSFSSSHVDTGLFGIYAGTSPSEAASLLPVIADEFLQMTENVMREELDRSKAQLKAGLLMALESSSSRAEQLGRQLLLFERPVPIEEIIDRVESLGEKDITNIARRLLESPLSIATVGDARELSEPEAIQALFHLS